MMPAALEHFLRDQEAGGPSSTQLAFAHRLKDVFALNQAIQRAPRSSAGADDEIIFATETGPFAFAAGDRIVFTRNGKELGVKNGM
ncbi:MAG: hypothetical protein AB7I34_05290 [Rhizobiaceae bacterium]